ncbi:hypothetical protein NPIL_87541 [Nephila pilipes]|uniref:Uncharacterized protein n=1 Tax=Nephila pilipes TaxID=299642 RepID=A0A8X6U6E7_NEPPI|nr:hypothetical protein NPIL_87541 [Nephila pilipes]
MLLVAEVALCCWSGKLYCGDEIRCVGLQAGEHGMRQEACNTAALFAGGGCRCTAARACIKPFLPAFMAASGSVVSLMWSYRQVWIYSAAVASVSQQCSVQARRGEF